MPRTQRDLVTAMRKDEIQLLIRRYRDAAAVPKAYMPPGLARMRHQELIQEATGRGIETADSARRYGIKTRSQLLEDIRLYEGEMVRLGATVFPDADEDFCMRGATGVAGLVAGTSRAAQTRGSVSLRELRPSRYSCYSRCAGTPT